MNPVGNEGLPVELLVVEIDHSAAGNSGSGGVLQREHFENQLERLRQFYTLSVGETQSFVVVQNGVQVFDPQRVRRTIIRLVE
jgi:hypothetical protein